APRDTLGQSPTTPVANRCRRRRGCRRASRGDELLLGSRWLRRCVHRHDHVRFLERFRGGGSDERPRGGAVGVPPHGAHSGRSRAAAVAAACAVTVPPERLEVSAAANWPRPPPLSETKTTPSSPVRVLARRRARRRSRAYR